MKLTPIKYDFSQPPKSLQNFLDGAKIYDSSSAPDAKVIYIDKEDGYFLKSANKGNLVNEVAMTRYLQGKGLSANVLEYISGEKVDFTNITACGENCLKCNKKADAACQGCIETGGYCREWAKSNGCPIAICANKQDVQFCGLCAKFPCAKLIKTITWKVDAVENLINLAAQYREWIGGIAKLINEAEVYSSSLIADCFKFDNGILFCAEDNPTMHDANHAVIMGTEDVDKSIAFIKSFYQSRGLIPRIYLEDGQNKTMRKSLAEHGFVTENIGNYDYYLLTRKNKITKTDNLNIVIADDYRFVDERLLSNINEEYVVLEPEAKERMRLYLRRMIENGSKLYIGYDENNEPTTIAALCYTANGLCYIDGVETGKRFQGRGYCRELISKIVNDTDRPTYLYTQNPIAARIYKEAGFTKINLRKSNTYFRAHYTGGK